MVRKKCANAKWWPCYSVGDMRVHLPFLIFLGLVIQSFSSTSAQTPKDPQALLVAAAPLYDFTDPAMKPWHLKATYQLYDFKGKPTEQGTFEYWWVSPKVHRASWLRPSRSWTDWHTPEGNHFYLASGGRSTTFETWIESLLFSPLPNRIILNPYKTRLVGLEEKLSDGTEIPCVELAPSKQDDGATFSPNFEPIYCFDNKLPVLHLSHTWGTLTTEFNSIAKFQGKYLAREISIYAGDRKIFSLSADSVSDISALDPALTPAPDAVLYHTGIGKVSSEVAEGNILKKQQPVYPEVAKLARQQGTVMMEATIGADGKIHDLEVDFAPSEALAESAEDAVSRWEYKPYLLNGKPVDVQTTVNVVFKLAQ